MANDGALFMGIAKGLRRGMERQQDLAQRKELLKLEQDKLKLMERETELTGQSRLYDAIIRANQPTSVSGGYVQGGQFRRTDQPEGVKLGPGDVFYPPTAEPGVYGDPISVPLTPQQQGVSSQQPAASIQMVNRLIEAGVPELQALDTVLRRDESSLIRALLEVQARSPVLPGMPPPDIRGLLEQYRRLLSNTVDPIDSLFRGLPPLPGSVQDELR